MANQQWEGGCESNGAGIPAHDIAPHRRSKLFSTRLEVFLLTALLILILSITIIAILMIIYPHKLFGPSPTPCAGIEEWPLSNSKPANNFYYFKYNSTPRTTSVSGIPAFPPSLSSTTPSINYGSSSSSSSSSLQPSSHMPSLPVFHGSHNHENESNHIANYGALTSGGRLICLSQACVEAAANLLKNMDQSSDACVDFYRFACGKWEANHILPSDRSHYDTFSLMKDKLNLQLKVLLEAPIDDQDSNATRKVKNFYASCVNESAIEKLGGKPLIALLNDQFGGWPRTKDPIQSRGQTGPQLLNWLEIMAKLRQYNNDILIGQWIGVDSKNSTKYVVQLDQAELGMGRDYFKDETPQKTAYHKTIYQVAKLLGADERVANTTASDIVDFETKLANITIPSELRRNYTAMYNKVTLAELKKLIKTIDWQKFFNMILPNGIQINDTQEIVIYATPYLQDLEKLLNLTPHRTIINYLLWRFVFNRCSNLDARFLAVKQEFARSMLGTLGLPSRWNTCVMYCSRDLGTAVGAMYVKAHFNEISKDRANEMIKDIRDKFLELLAEVDWMDDDTKSVAREKALFMGEKIGYPTYLLNDTELDADYDGVDFGRDTYFENVIASLKYRAYREQLKLNSEVDKKQWVTLPTAVNAFYTRTKNFISFPAGILQPPLYHADYPTSLNYGGIGVVIGHEITHGFDDKGGQFDQHGNLKQWWSEDALKKFHSKADCMIKQYSEYVVEEVNLNVNGINTQGENIADNGGVKQAYMAYKKRMAQTNWTEPLLPGVNLSHDQLFFLNYAQIWCGTMRPEAIAHGLRTANHSPGRFRVIGALSNSHEFSAAYGCPPGSPMNPNKKCSVW